MTSRLFRRRTPVCNTLLALVAACAASPAMAQSSPDQGDLIDRLNRLEREVAELRADNATLRTNAQAADRAERTPVSVARDEAELEALLADLKADAAKRDTLGTVAGYDGSKFFLKSDDGNFLLRPFGMVQFRYLYNHQDNAAAASTDADDDRSGFEVTRLRVGMFGHAFDPSVQYAILTGHGGDGSALLLDAWVKKAFENGVFVQAGQFKTPYLREYLVSEKSLALVERSMLSSHISCGYTQGVMAGWGNDDVRVAVSFNDGAGEINTKWFEEDTEWAFSGRGDWLVLGDWKDYADFQAWPDGSPLWAIGGGVHVQQGEYGTDQQSFVDANGNPAPGSPEVTMTRWTLDSTYKRDGWSFYAAVVGEHDSSDAGNRDQIGWLVQSGLFVTDQWELLARYEWGDPDMAGEDELSILTLGTNYFFRKHQLKLSGDVGYAFMPVPATFSSKGSGWRADSPDRDGQVLIRGQMQLYY